MLMEWKRGIRPADRLWGLIGKLCRYEITENSSTYLGIAILDCANLGVERGALICRRFEALKSPSRYPDQFGSSQTSPTKLNPINHHGSPRNFSWRIRPVRAEFAAREQSM